MPFSKTLTQTGAGQTTPWIVDQYANPQNIGANIGISGTVNYSIQGCTDDFSPQWDVTNNTPNWVDLTGFGGLTAAFIGQLPQGPWTMIRLVNSGTGTVTAKFLQSYAGRT